MLRIYMNGATLIFFLETLLFELIAINSNHKIFLKSGHVLKLFHMNTFILTEFSISTIFLNASGVFIAI